MDGQTMSRDILLSLIDPDPTQARRNFDAAALGELAQSIAENGLAVPVLLRPGADGRFILVHGERRLRAVQALGWAAIPAAVRDLTPEAARWLALAENVQRADLTPTEEARAFQAILETGIAQAELGRRLGKSQSYIATKLRFLKLPVEAQTALDAGALTEGHAKQLLRVPSSEKQTELARAAVAASWTVQRLKLAVDGTLAKPRDYLPETPAELVHFFFRKNGSVPRHDPYPEERMPDRCAPPVAVKRLPMGAIIDDPALYDRSPVSEGGTAWGPENAAWYAEIFDTLPPIGVFDVGGRYYLVDGRRRFYAAQLLGLQEIECRIYVGTYKDAHLYSCGANAANGLGFTKADLQAILRDPRIYEAQAGPTATPTDAAELARCEAVIETGIAELRQDAPAEIAAGPVDGLFDYWADRLGRAREPDYQVHELGQLFPMLTGREFAGMVQSIKTHGLIYPITLYEGQILDGKIRYAACKAAGVKPRFVTFPDDFPGNRGSALDYVLSMNAIRASYTEDQRAVIAVRLIQDTDAGRTAGNGK